MEFVGVARLSPFLYPLFLEIFVTKKPYQFAQDQRQMHAAWVKAAREGRLEIPCKTESDARRLRFTLYNAVKPLRDGRASLPEVMDAVENVTIHLYTEPFPMVLMQHKSQTSMMQSLLGALGEEEVSDTPSMTEEERESLARIQQLMNETTAVEVPTKKNPYFTREDR